VLDVTVCAEAVTKETEDVYKKIRPVAKLPGFRPGKAPVEMVKQHFAGKAKEEVIDSLMNKALTQFTREKEFRMISYPVLEDVKFEFGQEFRFKVRLEKQPEFKLKSYDKLKLEKTERTTSEQDVEKEIDSVRERYATLAPAQEETAEKKHYCIIDYSSRIDGADSKELAGKGQLIKLDAQQIIPGFADGIIGMKLNETRELDIAFPGDFVNKNFAGKKALFTVTLKEIKELKMPQADDDLAKDVGFENLQKLKDTIKANLDARNDNESRKELRDQVSRELLKENKFVVPGSLINQQVEDMLESAKTMVKKQNKFTEQDWEESVDALRDKYRPQAEEKVRLYFILNRIIEQEKITVSEEELSKQKGILKEYMKMNDAQADRYFEERKSNLIAMLKEEKVFDLIIGNAKIKVKKALEK